MSYCSWCVGNKLMTEYHDNEWGVPVFDDRTHFEYLMLEALQCGLSWAIVMNKRRVIRQCFEDFDFAQVARLGEDDVSRILNTDGMIRSEGKIRAVISNAVRFDEIRREFGSFSDYIWSYTDGKTVIYDGHERGYIPSGNALSDKISRELKRRGFKYLGSVTVYAYLQACGVVNDHDEHCHCYERLKRLNETVYLPTDGEHGVRYYG